MDVSNLQAGDHHYMAYVGPPTQYDFMGATQFRLLCTLGLRSNHFLLDFGCGSLRAGRLFIPYLGKGRYFGIEPNKWLVEDGIRNEVGEDQIRMKEPTFRHNDDFTVGDMDVQFDFIVAQSIFSHSGMDIVSRSLASFRGALKQQGIVAATFVEADSDTKGNGWVYPGCVHYRPSTLLRLGEDAGLLVTRIPWFHPRQTWYLFAKEKNRLPGDLMHCYLSGAVLF